MAEDDYGRLENVTADAIPTKGNKVYIFEIGKISNSVSRLSEVNKETGEEYDSICGLFGTSKDTSIEDVKKYLLHGLIDGKKIEEMYLAGCR